MNKTSVTDVRLSSTRRLLPLQTMTHKNTSNRLVITDKTNGIFPLEYGNTV
jgi:hypothetical protein